MVSVNHLIVSFLFVKCFGLPALYPNNDKPSLNNETFIKEKERGKYIQIKNNYTEQDLFVKTNGINFGFNPEHLVDKYIDNAARHLELDKLLHLYNTEYLNSFEYNKTLSLQQEEENEKYENNVSVSEKPPTDKATVFNIDRHTLQLLVDQAKYARIAYCIGTFDGIHEPFRCFVGCVQFPKTELIYQWRGGENALTGGANPGFIAVDHRNRQIVVQFRGATWPSDAFNLFQLQLVDYLPAWHRVDRETWATKFADACGNCRVGAGIYDVYRETIKLVGSEIEQATKSCPGYRLMLGGHNIGGSVAALVGLDLTLRGYINTVVTMGAPRFGNLAFAEFFEAAYGIEQNVATYYRGDYDARVRRYFRVTKTHELLTHWPFAGGYVDTAGEVHIKDDVVVDARENVVFHCMGRNERFCSAGDLITHDNLLFELHTHYKYFVVLLGCAFWQMWWPHWHLHPQINPLDPYS